MMSLAWPRDSIVRRFALTTVLAFAATFALNALFVSLAGVWGRPSLAESGLFQRAATVVRLIEASPTAIRDQLAAAASDESLHVDWYAHELPVPLPDEPEHDFSEVRRTMRLELADPGRTLIFLRSGGPGAASPDWRVDRQGNPDTQFMGVRLADSGWLFFSVPKRSWGLSKAKRNLLHLLFAALSIAASAMLTARSLARPIEALSAAVRRFGADPQAPPITPDGPTELRTTIDAFNASRAQIARFVSDRTLMLAAISHDLRTPLTRMRLRAELMSDLEQKTKTFRDVDEMQQMVNSALEFFRRDAEQEPATEFDLTELLLSIVDDYHDQGVEIGCEGARKTVAFGRPFALRRAFTNVIENSVKYASPPTIHVHSGIDGNVLILIRDRGPGIPPDSLVQVFEPFYRGDPSRHRSSGVGLGLTSARSIIRAHGGEIVLSNHPQGGCEARITFPVVATSSSGD